MFTVLIDDIRDLTVDIICRDGRVGLQICKYLEGMIECLYIDHDLGPNSMDGYQVIKTLLEEDFCPPNVQIVSSNPVGVKNIASALFAAGYTASLSGRSFKK